MKRYYGIKIFAGMGFVALAIAGVGFLVMWLWNALIPAIFGLPAITFFQAIGLLLLSRILFGGFPHRGGRGGDHRRHWKRSMKEKWANMTPEERAAFKKKMGHWRNRGCWPEDGETATTEAGDKEKPREEDLV